MRGHLTRKYLEEKRVNNDQSSQRIQHSDQAQVREDLAAVKIQAGFRGHRVRQQLKAESEKHLRERKGELEDKQKKESPEVHKETKGKERASKQKVRVTILCCSNSNYKYFLTSSYTCALPFFYLQLLGVIY